MYEEPANYLCPDTDTISLQGQIMGKMQHFAFYVGLSEETQ